jgi:hypothetical protein
MEDAIPNRTGSLPASEQSAKEAPYREVNGEKIIKKEIGRTIDPTMAIER